MSPLYWQEGQPVDSSRGRLLTFLALIQPFAEHLLRQISERTNTIPGECYSLKNDSLSNVLQSTSTSMYSMIDFRWLNDPQFVGSFETEDHVYFLFRESAVEYINCGKVIKRVPLLYSLLCAYVRY